VVRDERSLVPDTHLARLRPDGELHAPGKLLNRPESESYTALTFGRVVLRSRGAGEGSRVL